ncbi:MAG: DUF2764 family protein [Candidatus Omnitrophica bacterium]|nr:DUF2764 family protein [Candidatus Omnitrophota bacterium]
MGNYYYLTAQLPLLQFAQQREVPSREEFLEEARKWLTPRDFSVLEKVAPEETRLFPGEPGVLRQWKRMREHMRDEIGRWRRSKREGRAYREGFLPLGKITAQNPLAQEQALLKFQWEWIDERLSGHVFDLGFVILYFLQLQILLRLKSFTQEEGMKIFEKVCEVNHE